MRKMAAVMFFFAVCFLVVLFLLFNYGMFFFSDGFLFTKSKKKIIIDPGHGGDSKKYYYYNGSEYLGDKIFLIRLGNRRFVEQGKDANVKENLIFLGDEGAVFKNELFEKDINLRLALLLREELSRRYDVILTRDSDFYVPLERIVEIAEESDADLFLSIHFNSFNESCENLEGSEFYYNDGSVRKLGELIQKELNRNLNFSIRRGEKKDSYLILNSRKPSILFEINFICNENVARIVNVSENQKKIAVSVRRGIDKFYYG